MTIDRRTLLSAALASAAARGARRQYRAAIIGHTGHGDYGHGWDACFRRFDSIKVVAVADPDEKGRAAAMKRSGAEKGYRDFREMLRREKPDLAGIFPFWLEERLEMVTAAAEAGAHILMEKPFAPDLQSADKMIETAERRGVKIQVGYPTRVAAVTRRIREMVTGGEIGDLLEIRARGKEDRRVGGEDLMVLGTLTFDLMRFFAGDPKWVFAHVTQDGHEIGIRDAHRASQPVGPVAGDSIAAMFAFPNVEGYFASKKNDHPTSRFGVTLYGSGGVIAMPLASYPSKMALLLKSPSWLPGVKAGEWKPIEMPPDQTLKSRDDVNAAVLADLLDAIESDRPPACGARDGRWALEMALGVYQSQKSGGRTSLPLRDRRHPLMAAAKEE
jgi:predicted dehydrogenase